MGSLTNKQRAFVEEYLKDFNATQAALRAGYSERTAYSIGHENLKKPEIEAAIQENLAERAMTADEVLARLADMARGDLTQYVSASGEIDVHQMREDGLGHLLKKYHKSRRTIRQKGGGEIDIEKTTAEFYDAQAALVQIGRHHKLFTDNVDHTSKGEKITPVQYIEIVRPDDSSD